MLSRLAAALGHVESMHFDALRAFRYFTIPSTLCVFLLRLYAAKSLLNTGQCAWSPSLHLGKVQGLRTLSGVPSAILLCRHGLMIE